MPCQGLILVQSLQMWDDDRALDGVSLSGYKYGNSLRQFNLTQFRLALHLISCKSACISLAAPLP